MEVEVIETLEDVKVNRITDVRTYGLPDGWTMAQVRDLLLKNGFTQ